MAQHKVLIVEDEVGIRFGLRKFLEAKGYAVDEAETCQKAQEMCRGSRPDVALIDYLLPDGTALELLPRLKQIDPSIPVVILTAHGSIELAVRAIKEGAEQFLTKPVALDAVLVMVQRLVEQQRSRQRQLAGNTRQAREEIDPFIGTSLAIRELAGEAERVLASESPVLIHGETGTGKGVLARWLHEHGSRAEETYMDLNCAGLSREFLETELFDHEKGAFTGAVASKPGLLEIAHCGTVFLDEIGDMDPQVQPRLLKVLEEKRFRRLGEVRDRRVDIRLIAATHQELRRLIQEQRFRSDLYFRISTLPLHVPPLRARTEDIPLLAHSLLQRCAAELGHRQPELTAEAERALQAYAWPGNIRELRNVLERALLLSDHATLNRKDLRFDSPVETMEKDDLGHLTLEALERLHIARVLQEEQGNVERAAERLGIPRSTLYYKIKHYQLGGAKAISGKDSPL